MLNAGRVQLSVDLERFFELSPDLCCVLTFRGTVQASNAAWLEVLGYPRDEVNGSSFFDLLHADHRAAIEVELARHGRTAFATRCLCKDGSHRVLRWQTVASVEKRKTYAIGRPEALTVSRSERLMSLGQMALGVVHDLKNVMVHPLGLQLQRIDRALESEPKDRARAAIAAARDVLRDGIEAIDRLLRPQRAVLVDGIELDSIVWRAVEIARSYARSVTTLSEIQFDWQPGGPQPIGADTFDLLAAFVNVMFNAVDALGGRGGTVTVKTGDGPSGVWLTISDDGPGMVADVRDRIFEPFFTTKPDGVGLGLSLVQACVVRHTGAIRVITAPGGGTTMRIELPVK